MISDMIAQANHLLSEGHRDEALTVLRGPYAADAPAVERYEIGEALLRASNGRRGWELYDLHPSRSIDRLRRIPRWDSTRCNVLVVIAEQGFGDAIQFLRFVPSAVRWADQVVFAVHDELLEVVRSSPMLAGVEVIAKTEAHQRSWPDGTRWERLMSLPARLPDLVAEPIGPYIDCPRTPIRDASQFTIGVAWRSTTRRGFPSRSFPAGLLRQVAEVDNVRLIALHRDQDIRTTRHPAEVVGIRNLTDTAAAIARCDCVITADTVTAHLAPALGVTTFICLRHRPDWRWGTHLNPTRWYANQHLLFQDATMNWTPVLREAAEQIRTLAAVQG